MASGLALKMKCELAELARKHGVVQVPYSIPLAPPTQCAMVLRGLASTGDLDFDRCRFASFSFGLLHKSKIRLLHAHDETQTAGEILNLNYDPHGNLLIETKVSHPQAVRCAAFSIGGRVRSYRLVDTDRPTFHAVIDNCELSEISLVDRPANRFALVKSRYPADARSKYLDDLSKWVGTWQKFAAVLPQLMVLTSTPSCDSGDDLTHTHREPLDEPPIREMTPQDRLRLTKIHEREALRHSAPSSSSSFSSMVSQLNQRPMEA